MRINYYLDSNNVIIGYTIIPFNADLPSIEVESETDIHVGFSQIINGEFIANDEAAQIAMEEKAAKDAILSEISSLKNQLSKTDYQAIKFAEGQLTAEEFASMRAQRQEWRDQINELENQLEEAK